MCLFQFWFPQGICMEEAMAPHSSTLAWKIPWMEEPGRLQSMGSLSVGHDWMTTFTFHFHALEKEMATHSSVLAWRIPGIGEPGGLLSMGSHRVRHDWSDLAAAAAFVEWQREVSRTTSDLTIDKDPLSCVFICLFLGGILNDYNHFYYYYLFFGEE